MKILLLEDEKKLGTFIQKGLRESGYACEWFTNGDEVFHIALTENFDAFVLDIMVPGRDGLSILKQLRKKRIHTPVIIISARGELDEKIEGLEIGADDYLTKPFYIEELIARLRTIMRRANNQPSNILSIGDLTMDLSKRKVYRAGRSIELSIREFALLEFLMHSPERVFPRTQIVEHVWESHFDRGSNLVDVYVSRLREKIELPGEEKLIQTKRGIGYSISLRKTP